MDTDLQTQPIGASFFEEREHTLAAWLWMAGVMINARGSILLIDPLMTIVGRDGRVETEDGYRMRGALPVETKDLPRADLVMYTHADDDHFGRTTAKLLAERLPCRFLVPPPVERELREMGIAAERIRTAREQESVRVGAAEIIVTPAMHDWQDVNPWKREDCCGYLVKTPDGSIWHPGDTRLIDDLLAIEDVDVMFYDVAAVISHLGPQGSARLAKSCGAKVMVAYHYGIRDMPAGSYGNCDPDDALPYLKGVSGRYIKPVPGEVLVIGKEMG
jgi:L-ascorbate metabolism protein UlaG (beta-lactamase superfamily)